MDSIVSTSSLQGSEDRDTMLAFILFYVNDSIKGTKTLDALHTESCEMY